MSTKTREWKWPGTNKEAWGAGPWVDEADKVQWVDEDTGLDCLIHRGPSGALCGYVGVPEGHPFFGVDYSQCAAHPSGQCEDNGGLYCEHTPESRMEVHGGLTFADFCRESDDPSSGICHVPFEGRPDKVWWLGFDCAHSCDLSPKYDNELRGFRMERARYRDRDYVERECAKLAKQLAAVSQATEATEAP